ncbi:hypothetical protein GCM10027088_53110 [Nocardia goodfellowii]|uniref:Uncharacterized protein n=1 Tax=Nocardia goodfellowii TaxID=882446 RepID=A0ABS4QHM5_9NOCA|nr:hypothetical protein [Nocardia goodfellowii]
MHHTLPSLDAALTWRIRLSPLWQLIPFTYQRPHPLSRRASVTGSLTNARYAAGRAVRLAAR